jgi:uncharacterized membrane protein HdeD (DUF308 family)
MVATMGIRPTLGGGRSGGLRTIRGKWGWFLALGIVDVILGGLASTDLILANVASVLVVGAAVWLASSLVYAFAGAVILYDPVLASLQLLLLAGAFLVVAGRCASGLDSTLGLRQAGAGSSRPAG